jgi:formylglycine-generating enzyme required for sulfatase activity
MHRWIVALVLLATPAAAQVREPDMVPIPAGTFLMGTTDAEDQREGVPADMARLSKPVHMVAVPAFLLAKTPITRAEYAAFVRATGRRPAGVCYGLDENTGRDWRHPGFPQTDRDPVVCVSYNDAMAYIAWLNRHSRAGAPYRLPSEAEWEYAARGRVNQTAARFWGDDRSLACEYANVADRSLADFWGEPATDPAKFFPCQDGFTFPAPVASFKPNDYGLYDMLGNVWQWTADRWHDDYAHSPNNGLPDSTGAPNVHILRGTAWNSDPWSVRAGNRGRLPIGTRGIYIGFRLARSR